MSQTSRRQFLEQSMFATAATLAAGSALTIQSAQAQSSSPNEKLRVAVVGVRGRGTAHIGAFAGRKDTEVAYICDVDSEVAGVRVEEVAKRQDGTKPKFEKDIRKVLEDKSIDIVSIATPNHWHALGAIWAIQAGKDVYVEKPVSHNVSEGRRIVEAARKYNKICQTGTQSRSNPGLREAVEFIRGGGIGNLKVARGLCYKPRGSIGARGSYNAPSSVDYDLWLGPAPKSEVTRPQFHYDWHWQWAYGNGDLGNQGIHQMDIARWGLGIDRLSNSVFSYGGRYGYQDAGETANTQIVVHDYGNQSLVFEVRGLKTPAYKGAGVGVIFEGTDGYLVVPSYASATAFDKDGKEIKTFSGEADHFENFLSAVRSRKSSDLNADIEQGHYSSALCHLGNISYRLGQTTDFMGATKLVSEFKSQDNSPETFDRTIQHLTDNKVNLDSIKIQIGKQLKINPETETFVNEPEADTMLTREYRAPFVVPEAGKV